MKVSTALGLLVAIGLQWSAAAQAGVVSSLGSRSCSAVVASSRDGRSAAEQYRQWLLGFLSGLNASRLRSHETPFNLTDEDAHWQWIVRRCDANPQMTLFGAATALWNELLEGRSPALARPFFPTSE